VSVNFDVLWALCRKVRQCQDPFLNSWQKVANSASAWWLHASRRWDVHQWSRKSVSWLTFMIQLYASYKSWDPGRLMLTTHDKHCKCLNTWLSCEFTLFSVAWTVFTARCTLVQSASCDHMSSVSPSMTLVDCDHIGWNSSEIISPLAWDVRSLQTQRSGVYSNGNTRKFWPKVTHPPVDLIVGDIRSQIAAEWLQTAQRSQWRAYIKTTIALSNGAIANTLRPSFSPKWGSMCPKIREWPYLRNEWSDTLHVWF